MTDATAEDVLARRAAWSVDVGDCLAWMKGLPDACVQCCVTSPPYFGLRDYGPKGQIGLEDTPEQFVANLVAVFREVRRVLRPDGLCFVNLGDSYSSGDRSGHGVVSSPKQRSSQGTVADGGARRPPTPVGCKPKDLLMIPAQVAIALRADGWYLRSEIIWSKKSPMPESVRDRCTRSHEMIYMLSKGKSYFYDQEAERVGLASDSLARNGRHGSVGSNPDRADAGNFCGSNDCGRNLWTVWDDISPTPFPDAHFATFPEGIPRRCLRLGSSLKGCCPACGSPWRRVVERARRTRQRPNEYVKRAGEEGTGNSCANTVAGVSVTTTGWAPSCGCGTYKCDSCSLAIEFPPSRDAGTSGRTSDEENSTCESLPDLPAGVPDVAPGAEVLQHLLRAHREPERETTTAQVDCSPENVSNMPDRVQASMVEDSVLQQNLRGEGHREESAGEVHDDEGLRPGVQADPSPGDEGGIHHGAPTGDGGASPENPAPDGSRASQEWDQGRQSHRKPGGAVKKGTRPKAKTKAPRDTVPALPGAHHHLKCCPACSGEMTLTPYPSVGCLVLDPFTGSGPRGAAARDLGMRFLGVDLNPDYAAMARRRIGSANPLLDACDVAAVAKASPPEPTLFGD